MARTTKRQALQTAELGPPEVHFYPRSYQLGPWHAVTRDGFQRLMLIWHRQAGKDYTLLWCLWWLMCHRPGQYFHIFPSYGQAKRAVWEATAYVQGRYVKYLDLFPPQLIEAKSETELQVRLAPIGGQKVGSIYQLLGAENADAIRGTHPAGVILSEYRDMRESVWTEVVEPAVLSHKGFAAFASTPRGKNHLWALWEAVRQDPAWYCQLLPCTGTHRDAQGEDGLPIFSPADIEGLRRGKDEATIQQEYFCSFEGNLEGAVYGREIQAAADEGRIGQFPVVTNAPCGTMWDLGYADATAVWVYQVEGDWVTMIDYLEDTRRDIAHFAHLLKEQRPYTYARHTMPWDVEQQHDGKTRREAAERLGLAPIRVAKKCEVAEGIDQVRRFFPRLRFNAAACAKGIEALRNYRYEWDEARQEFKQKPLHDRWSHGADALRTGVTAWQDGLGFRPRPTWTHAIMAHDIYDYDREEPALHGPLGR